MAKTDEILDHIITIKEDVAGIKEHLKTLNGKVATNVNQIEEGRKLHEINKAEIEKINKKIYIVSGVLLVLGFIAPYIIPEILKRI
jgi:peptidoglycan hydrolase CwlO-like protein